MACSEATSELCTDEFYRLAKDFHCSYGNGGDSFLQYPVWINESMKLNECRERLVQALHKHNNQRQNHQHEPSPVEDIIDPDLLVCRPSQFDREIWIKKRVKEYKDDDYNRYDDDDEKLENKTTIELDKEIIEHVKLRSTYQWMPAVFQIDQNSHVTITTPIPQLERISENEQLYRDIVQVLEAMLPAF
ncbi:unnamed protein product [Rotaria sp. Silwood1]|nr:unnamed protein product [Rotaria sp. Silwood1]CAF3947757.1 unnamed protein product [Rotaria sp. Silwood1]CAF4959980.1 unnamed protein product [Rotaria sp. Silwood1]CAF5010060.1 unnamed protein product [Rotaria sp. Silwood1]